MKRIVKDILLGVRDVPFAFEGVLGRKTLSYAQKIGLARRWLKDFELRNIEFLRSMDYSRKSQYDTVTIVTYTFPKEESDYLQVEFAILHTWRILGRMKTVIVADRDFEMLSSFAGKWHDTVSVQYQPELVCGDNRSISADCLKNLYKRFSTEYCLMVQDDGFPLRDDMEEFLGRYDYLGAPLIRRRCRLVELLIEAQKGYWLNGGFSLRSRRLCELGAKAYSDWVANGGEFQQEDLFFSQTLRRISPSASALRFPTLKCARTFAATDVAGLIDVHARGLTPFGFHSPTTAVQYISELKALGYDVPPLM